jgi:hypothetical protein
MPPDTHPSGPVEAAEAERLALEAAVAEARASGPTIPHDVVRQRMAEMIATAQERIATLQREAAEAQARQA